MSGVETQRELTRRAYGGEQQEDGRLGIHTQQRNQPTQPRTSNIVQPGRYMMAGQPGTVLGTRTDRLTLLARLHTIKSSMNGRHWLPTTLVLGLLAGCGASRKLSEDTAKEKILELGVLDLKDKQVQVQRIIQSGEDQAVAEASFQMAFQLSKTKGKDWQVSAIRLGDRDWINAEAFLAALNEVRARQTQQSLEQLQEGIRKYQAKRGPLPAVSDIVKLTDLLFPEYMREVNRYDAWNHEFSVRSVGDNAFQLSSAGPDGVPGNADDIRLEVRPI